METFFRSTREGNEDEAIQQLEASPSLANTEVEVGLPGHMGDKLFTFLIAAADQNLLRLAKSLICYGADVTSQHGPDGGSALHLIGLSTGQHGLSGRTNA